MIFPVSKTKLKMIEIIYRKGPIMLSALFKEARASPQAGYKYLEELLASGIISEKIEGKKPVLRYLHPNFKNNEAISVFSLIEADAEKRFLEKHANLRGPINQLKSELEDSEITGLIFGSFARGSETKESDLDVLFIAEDRKYKRKIESICEISFVTLKNRPSIRILESTEFISLKKKGDSFITGIIKDHVCICNPMRFVTLSGRD